MQVTPLRVAVVGSGASAYAVVERLLAKAPGRLEITVVAPADRRPPFPLRHTDPRTWSNADWNGLHKRIRATEAPSFPPPRSQFGAVVSSVESDSDHQLGATDLFGGLSDFWSTAMFPYQEADFDGWPVGAADLAPYYDWIADAVGIAGASDGLSRFFDDRYVNRPPIGQPRLVSRLVQQLGNRAIPGHVVGSGTNRLAVETRPGAETACVYCGGCFYGCHRNSLFRPGKPLLQRVRAGEIVHRKGRVTHLARQNDGRTVIEIDGGAGEPFDLVILCAGALGTTTLLARSLGLERERLVIHDNEMFNFPILYRGLLGKPYRDHFSISSGVVGIQPLDPSVGEYGHYLFAPLPSLLFRFYLPKGLVNRLTWLTRIPKGRFLICQMYTGGASAIGHELELDGDTPRTHMDTANLRPDAATRQIRTLKTALKGSSFWAPPFPLMRVKSSYHYAGGFPYGDPHIGMGASCQVWPGLHVADSTVFPPSPAQQFTFTIMANAARVVDEALAARG